MRPDLVQQASTLALEAHAGQVDKQGRDYFQHHLLPVAALLRPYGVAAETAGLLHDLVEDTAFDYADLSARGFPPVVVEAVRAVTRIPDEPYPDLIQRAATHPLGRLVKLADNWVNLTGLSDLALVDPAKAVSLRRRYEAAREVLEQALVTAGA